MGAGSGETIATVTGQYACNAKFLMIWIIHTFVKSADLHNQI
jgi:hypothetical protein